MMAKRGQLDVPVIGVAKAGWIVDQLQGTWGPADGAQDIAPPGGWATRRQTGGASAYD